MPLKLLAYLSLQVGVCVAFSATMLSATATSVVTSAIASDYERFWDTPQQHIAQQKKVQTGSIEGTVRDKNHRAIPGATVTLTDLSTNEVCKKCTAVANADGVFRLIDVPAARYELRVTQEGFDTYSEPSGLLAPGQVIDLEVQLTPTSASPPAAQSSLPQIPLVNQPSPASEARAPQAEAPYPGVIQRVEQPPPAEAPPPARTTSPTNS